MLNPSYSELMDVLNKGQSVDNKITSRYIVVIAAAKRARQLIDGTSPTAYNTSEKAVSTAVKEMSAGLISIKYMGMDMDSIQDDEEFDRV